MHPQNLASYLPHYVFNLTTNVQVSGNLPLEMKTKEAEDWKEPEWKVPGFRTMTGHIQAFN